MGTLKLFGVNHQENLCVKISNAALNDVMAFVTKIHKVNFFVARSATTYRQFQRLLEEIESAYQDVTLHCGATWLSRTRILLQFVKYLFEIRTSLIGQVKTFPELEVEK